MKVEESLNVTFDEIPPPTKLSPLVDDDVGEEEAIRKNTKIVNINNEEDESIEVDEIVNIKESKNHPLDQVIGNLNQRTLRSQAQNHSNFFCFISTIEPKDVKEALKDESWVVAMQEELNQFVANDVWELSKYIKEMLKKFGLEDSKPTKTLTSTEIKLTKDDESDSVDSSKYQGKKRVAYPVVANYVRNTWGKYGLVKSMLNSSTGLFSFQFSSMDRLDAMLENGPWVKTSWMALIRCFSEGWLECQCYLIGTTLMLGLLIRLNMLHVNLRAEASYARAMIELRADVELKETLWWLCLKLLGRASIRVIFVLSMSGNLLAQDQEANSSGSSFWNVNSSSPSTTPIIEKIDKIEKLIIDGKVTLVDDEVKPLEKVEEY
ncbi:hypothetical protein Tco_1070256 [Tanacetum coccineum]|uniref:DUF4283 domain-containing protein n=1 Tax=Tanacetum coccineum TaxID=301880 RepID=A0ABQ5HL66_9ASTR